ncbi:MAG: D-alanyl-D-alanine carboxypeptidase, partial [Tangfeifania sp.]
MKARLFILLAAVLISEFAVSQQKFETALQKLLEKPEYRHATAGIHIIDLNSGQELYGYNSEKLMIPASTMKLVTSAAALELLGPDYRFQTKIGYTG